MAISFVRWLVILGVQGFCGAQVYCQEAEALRPDSVSTDTVFQYADIGRLPVRSLVELLGTCNGTALYYANPREGYGQSVPLLSVRGGPLDGFRTYLNGADVTDPFTGYCTFNISSRAIRRLKFDSFDASGEYRGGGFGYADVVTRGGGERLSAMAEAISDNSLGTDFDQNWYTFALGGPVGPLEDLRFIGLYESRYFGDRAPSIKTQEFLPGDFERLPSNTLRGLSYSGRLDWQATSRWRFSFTADGSQEKWREYSQPYFFNSVHAPYYRDENRLFTGSTERQINSWLTCSLNASYFKVKRFRGDGEKEEDLAAYDRGFLNPTSDVNSLFYLWEDCDFYYDSLGNLVKYGPAHYYDDYYRHTSERVQVAGAAEIRLPALNKVRLGFEYRRYTIRMYHNDSPTYRFDFYPGYFEYYGYDSTGSVSGSLRSAHEAKHPKELAVYLSDVVRWGDLSVRGSLRLDIYDYNEREFVDAARPFDPGGSGPSSDLTIDDGDLRNTEAFWRWSPAIELAAAPNDRFRLTAAFGVSYQRQPFELIFVDYDNAEFNIGAGSWYMAPWPSLAPVKATSYELGFNARLSPKVSLGAVIFGHDYDRLVSGFRQTAVPYYYVHYDEGNDSRSRGAELGLDLRPGASTRLQVCYTLSSVKDISSLKESADFAWGIPGILPDGYTNAAVDQRHALSALIDLGIKDDRGPSLFGAKPLENLRTSILFQLMSGHPYTPTLMYNSLNIIRYPHAIQNDKRNSAREPLFYTIDLKLERPISFSSVTLTPFLWVKNLLDRENVIQVYSGTGKPDETGYLTTEEGMAIIDEWDSPDDTSWLTFKEKYELAQRDPLNYWAPRQVMFGIRVSL